MANLLHLHIKPDDASQLAMLATVECNSYQPIERMHQLNIGMTDAYQLVRKSPEVTGVDLIWSEVQERYKDSRVSSGTIKATNYAEHEENRINRAVALITARTGAAHDGGGLMRLYTGKHLMQMEPGSSGQKRNMLDVARFLKFAINKCGANKKWLPLECDDRKELIGLPVTRQ